MTIERNIIFVKNYIEFHQVSLLSPDENLQLKVEEISASDSPSGSEGSYSYSLVQNG